jgi:hypothetical protein
VGVAIVLPTTSGTSSKYKKYALVSTVVIGISVYLFFDMWKPYGTSAMSFNTEGGPCVIWYSRAFGSEVTGMIVAHSDVFDHVYDAGSGMVKINGGEVSLANSYQLFVFEVDEVKTYNIKITEEHIPNISVLSTCKGPSDVANLILKKRVHNEN